MSETPEYSTTLVRDDLNAVITYTAESHSLKFAAYEQGGWDAERVPGELAGLWFERRGADNSMDQVQDIALAQPMMTGFIKWDGCSHYYFGDSDGYLHLCGGAYVRQFAALTTAIFDLAAEKVEKWDAEVAR